MKNDGYKFWVYVISDGKSNGILVKRQIADEANQECKYFHFAGGLSPTYEILQACSGDYVQLHGGLDEKRFVDSLINYIVQDSTSGNTKKARVIDSFILDGQDYQTVVNHFFERSESPLRNFFVNPNVFKQNILTKVRNKDNEYIGVAEEFGVLSPHNLVVEGFKYLRPIQEILRIGEAIPAKWFRRTGPLAADFDANTVYCRRQLLTDLKNLVFSNFFSVLEGVAATGKTVLVRQLGYELCKDKAVYYFDCDRRRDFDQDELETDIDNVKGVVIIENIHLETRKFQYILDRAEKNEKRHILFVARPSFRESEFSRDEKLSRLNSMTLKPFAQVDEIINCFTSLHTAISWPSKICQEIKNVSANSFWLMAYALKGCVSTNGKGEVQDWLGDGVKEDLEELEKVEPAFPEVLVSLSPLYQNETLTDESFLINGLGFDQEMLQKLSRNAKRFV